MLRMGYWVDGRRGYLVLWDSSAPSTRMPFPGVDAADDISSNVTARLRPATETLGLAPAPPAPPRR